MGMTNASASSDGFACGNHGEERLNANVSSGEPLATVPAMCDRIGFVAASEVDGALVVGIGGRGPPFAIAPERHKHVEEVLAPLGQAVLAANGVVLVGLGAEQSGRHQSLETIGEGVAGDAQAANELVEAAYTQECVTENEDRPGVVHDLDSVGDRTFEVGERLASHPDSLVSFELQFTSFCGKLRIATYIRSLGKEPNMTRMRRRRRQTVARTLKQPQALYVLDEFEIQDDLEAHGR